MASISRPPATNLRAAQAEHLDAMKESLRSINAKDVVPILVARRVLQSFEMTKVYDQESGQEQMDALIDILKTKTHWMGPMTDALIRNGQGLIAQQLIQLQTAKNT
ncbi:unnamed protein product, partial [Mesorhabditis spiculigera]